MAGFAEARIFEREDGSFEESGLERLVPPAVVLRALGRIRQNGESFAELLELFLGSGVSRIDVGMVLSRLLPVGRLDVLRRNGRATVMPTL
jgi:hypothetical protein